MFARTDQSVVMYSSSYIHNYDAPFKFCLCSTESPGEITALPFDMEIGPFKNAQQMWRRTPVRSAHLMKEQWIYFGNVRFTCMEKQTETRMLAFIKPAVILATNICCLSCWHSYWMCMLCYSNEKLWHLYKLMQGNAWTDGSNLKPRPCGTVAPDVVQNKARERD